MLFASDYIGDLKMVQVKTDVYPGFATDLQQPITPLPDQEYGRAGSFIRNRWMRNQGKTGFPDGQA